MPNPNPQHNPTDGLGVAAYVQVTGAGITNPAGGSLVHPGTQGSPSNGQGIGATAGGVFPSAQYALKLSLSGNGQLGAAANYAVLAAAGITNTGSTVVSGGDIGSFPTTTITGFPPGVITPPYTVDNADAAAAQTAALAAYNFYVAYNTGAQAITTADLGTQSGNGGATGTYRAGKYTSPSSIAITTPIILDAQGNANALFVFYATASTVTQAAAGTITLANGALASNVIWVVGSSFTSVGASTTVGQILANTSITLGGGTLTGRALAGIVAPSGAVTISSAVAITTTPGTGSSQLSVVIVDVKNNVYPGSMNITSVATSSGGVAVYTGTFPGGAANAFAGMTVLVAGFVATPANNGTFLVTASTATTLTLANTAAVAETHAATATGQVNTPQFVSYNNPSKGSPSWFRPSPGSSNGLISNYATDVVSVSSTGLVTALGVGSGVVEIQYPTFDNSESEVGQTGFTATFPKDMIFAQIVVTVGP